MRGVELAGRELIELGRLRWLGLWGVELAGRELIELGRHELIELVRLVLVRLAELELAGLVRLELVKLLLLSKLGRDHCVRLVWRPVLLVISLFQAVKFVCAILLCLRHSVANRRV